MKRLEIADLILDKIISEKSSIQSVYKETCENIGYFYIDNLLPGSVAHAIYKAFPKPELMELRKSLREYKYIAAQMDQYNPILEEAIFAFQDKRILTQIKEICRIQSLFPDEKLYAGGISLMQEKQFLNPHLDNSHDNERKRWRVLNLLYYVTPDWDSEYGGNLELWPNGLKEQQITIDSLFNRLVVMATHGSSWHSVSPIKVNKKRACVSNYYFSNSPLMESDEFHITSFRGRPEQSTRDLVLQADILLRQGLRKFFPKGAVKTDHVYKKSKKK